MNTPDGRTNSNLWPYDWRPYIPLACTPLVFVLAEFLIQRFGTKPVMLPEMTVLPVMPEISDVARLALDMAEGSRRNALLAVSLLWLVSVLALTATLLYEVWTNRTRSHRLGWLIGVLVLPIVLAIGYIYLSKASGRFDSAHAFVGGEEFFAGVISLTGGGSGWGTISLDLLIFGLSILAGATIGVVGAGCVSANILGTEGDIDAWKLQASRLQRYIYFGAGLFVVGVLCSRLLFSYPDFALRPESLPGFTALVNALLTYLGIEYALVLASLAIPSLLLLQAAGKKLARGALGDRGETPTSRQFGPGGTEGAGPASSRANELVWVPAAQPRKVAISDADVADYLKSKAMVISTGDIVKTIVALLAPAVTGGLASLTSLPLPAG